jgi:hypothetical protein
VSRVIGPLLAVFSPSCPVVLWTGVRPFFRQSLVYAQNFLLAEWKRGLEGYLWGFDSRRASRDQELPSTLTDDTLLEPRPGLQDEDLQPECLPMISSASSRLAMVRPPGDRNYPAEGRRVCAYLRRGITGIGANAAPVEKAVLDGAGEPITRNPEEY